MAETAQEKTEQPTGRRLQKARGQGQVARSADLSSGLVLLTGILALLMFGKSISEQIRWAFTAIYNQAPYITLTTDNLPAYFHAGSAFLLQMLTPFMLVVVTVALLANMVQTRFLFTSQALKFKLSNLNPGGGLKRLFSARAWAELAKGILKVIIVGWIGYLTIMAELPDFIRLVDRPLLDIITVITTVALKLSFRVALVILILGILDFQFQKFQHIKSLKMTKQEVKDEHKQTEGDPKVKSRIRRIQFQASLNRMIKKLPEADVVVANPVHLAVALKYDADKMAAPRVVAKGARLMAEKIKSIARENDIPVIEDPPLARALYKSVEVGMEIPYDLYQAVAEVLAMVYRLREAA